MSEQCDVLVVQAGGNPRGGYACIREQGHPGGHVALCVQPGVRR